MAELLVVVPDAWRAQAERLVHYKQDTGLSAALLTLGEIENGFAGVDQPERIKRAIEQRHRVNGVEYVLLAGDVDQFPARYIKAMNTEWGTVWYPSDLYYADLYDVNGVFEDWDADGDGIFAELDFGHTAQGSRFNLDSINIYPDVAIGRVPASTESEMATYVDKVIRYEFAARESRDFAYPDAWFRRALFLVDGGSSPFGDETESSQQEAPLAASGFNILHRYQDDAPWSGLTDQQRADEIVRLLNDGVGFLHVMGHGGRTGYAGWLTANDVAGLTNPDKLPVVVAISCYTAQFHADIDAYAKLLGGDWTGSGVPRPDRPQPAPIQPQRFDRDSMAESFLVQADSGAVAYVGAVSKFEHGGKPLGLYLTEAYQALPKPPTIGAVWRRALTQFTTNELGGGTIGMGPYYAFIHVHKVMLFGDPSLRVGGLAPVAPFVTGPAVLSTALLGTPALE